MQRWIAMSNRERIYALIVIPCSLAICVLAVLQLAGVWEKAAYVYLPLMAIVMLTQALRFWKSAKSVSILSLCAAVVILICCAVVYFSN